MAEVNAFFYALPCTARAVSYFPNKSREGFFLRIASDAGVGIGEYAPLTGFHHMSVHEAITSAKKIAASEMSRALFENEINNYDDLAENFSAYPQPISYLLSMAHFHRSMSAREIPAHKSIKLAALIETSDAKAAIDLAQTYVAQGFTHLKIKIGSLAIDEEVRKIKTIAAIAGKNIKLRLDANRRYNFADASTLLCALKKLSIEYFEEPTYEIDRLHELYDEHGAPIAVDESLTDISDLNWLSSTHASHVIIKPARFNNLYTTIKLVTAIQALNLTPIFSHCFESEYSSAIFAMMIDALGLADSAHGIVVDGIFRQGVFTQPLRSFRGQLSVAQAATLANNFSLRDHRLCDQVF